MPPFLTPLDQSDLRKLDIPAPWCFGMADMVRFAEVDALNHANNVAYLRWFETIRVRFQFSRGFYKYHPDQHLVLRNVICDYRAPLFRDDAYLATLAIRSYRATSFVEDYAIWHDGRICATGTGVMVATDASEGGKVPFGDEFRKVLDDLGAKRDA